MSFFLVFIAILVAGAIAWYAVDAARGTGGRTPEADDASSGRPAEAHVPEGLEEPLTGLPPVLLPEHPNPEDVDNVRFALAFRGYRMDQVDEVLARLRDRIGVQAALIQVLTAQVKARSEPAVGQPSARPAHPPGADD